MDRPDVWHHVLGTRLPDGQGGAPTPAGRTRHRALDKAGRPRRVAFTLFGIGVVLLGVVVALLHTSGRSGGSPTRPRPTAGGTATAASPSTPAQAGHGVIPSITGSLQAPVDPTPPTPAPGIPIQVTVARVGISSTLEMLGLMKDGSLQSPTEFGRAGWYAGQHGEGIRPGAIGPAVIAGHVDSVSGPAVFYRLRDVIIGDDVTVRDNLGTVRHFTVSDIESYPKSRFPTQAVYGATPLPVLRLVTCYGDFDASKRSYVDNLVVTADLQEPRAG